MLCAPVSSQLHLSKAIFCMIPGSSPVATGCLSSPPEKPASRSFTRKPWLARCQSPFVEVL